MGALAVICTSSITSIALEHLLEAGENFAKAFYIKPIHLSDTMRIIASRDPKHCIVPKSRTLPPFKSPFEGETADNIRVWYQANHPKFDKCELVQNYGFIILDSQTNEDNNTCSLVVFLDEYEPVQTMRCNFSAAFQQIFYPIIPWWPWDGADVKWRGFLRRSKLIMTENNCDAGAMNREFLTAVNGALEINKDTQIEDGIESEDIVEYL